MGSKVVFFQIKTNKSMGDVKAALYRSLLTLGGTCLEAGDGFQVTQGVNGVSMAFSANMEAFITIRQSGMGVYDLMANITWKPNTLMWVCLVVGFFVFGILWVVPLLYLFIDPTSAYQQVFFQTQASL